MIQEGMQNSRLSTWTRNGLFYETFAKIFDVYTLEIDPQSLEARGKPRVLDFTPTGSNHSPIWSPDGKHLAFYSFTRGTTPPAEIFVVVMPSEGGKARKFSFPTGYRLAGSYKWFPDSSGLGFVLSDKERRRLFLARVELDTGEWKTSPISAAGLSIYWNNIEWSGDGKSFFIIKKEDDGSEQNITRVDLETGQEHCLFRLPKGRLLTLKASRDYKRLATGRGGKIVLVDAETGHAERLEYEKNYKELYISYPAWSPDGKHLVVIGASNEERASEFEIFIISLPDGQLKSLNISRYLPRRLRFFPTCQPDWSPDGRKIVFNTQLFTGEFNLIQNLLPKK
jgi:Tol biopolymer transport system component